MTIQRMSLAMLSAIICGTLFAEQQHPGASLSEWVHSHKLEAAKSETIPDSDFKWFDAQLLTVEGRAYTDTLTPYSRLDMKYKGKVTDGVWNNARCSAGVTVRFVTDATTISASWDNDPPMNHMAYTGSGGLDLYAREGDQWVYRGTGMPVTKQTTATSLIQKNFKGKRQLTEYMVFLPLYSKVEKLQIGVTDGTTISPAAPISDKKPIVFYGTSITQGGCASRSGMAHPEILRRKLDWPTINLGFSGSGRCEMIMCEALSEIPASLYILETVPNMTPALIDERVVPFVKQLRKNHPDTPILMIQSPNVTKDIVANGRWKVAYDKLIQSEKVPNLHYLAGDGLYEGGEEPTVDGVHPTDLGFSQMAKAYEPVIRDLLGLKK